MSIKVKLFGDLKSKIDHKNTKTGPPAIITLENTGIERIEDVIAKLSIEQSEVSHIFVNHKYSGYKKTVRPGDTVAFFPINMSLLYKWYYPKEND
jgi:molybdopterin converting factor small subunit